ncbi:MAG: bifunctional demethylmenaquinone methyltransferase/2-methoxy-6-polyprenyl-1,4-benzoquinol methylase UbiE [Proteobacteria bacterium]|jgi:demethylmenaquinone methyltransferase/2-methoxy-6-polyprenyl-1,4-benzoquinol methylase|nr:bifunctional demethylmenaquinone methyltransferase/2-methoxy-6-polyprenyl-1,4-benzoquinol methylase UbiE [Pseudomonadota bacterium]
MGNRFYEAGERRAARVNDLFAAIAPRYDLINDLQSFGLHRWWKRRLIELATVKPGDTALDLCCGTGDVAFALAAAGAQATGMDFSAPMLAVAEERRQKAKGKRQTVAVERVQFVQGDALHMPFPEAHFDIVTISYGLRNLASVEGGLREIWRVVKPGGRVLVLEFGKPDKAVWRWCYFTYLRCAVPVFGLLFSRNAEAYAYILESLHHYPAQRGVDEKLRALGAVNARIVNFLGGMMSINVATKPG